MQLKEGEDEMEDTQKAIQSVDPIVKEMDDNIENLKQQLGKLNTKTIEKMEEMFNNNQ